jgi:hypothetical protein
VYTKSCAAKILRAPHGSTTCGAWRDAPVAAPSPSEPKRWEPEATSAHMPSEKPKATPAQPQPSDDLDKWIDAACENDAIEVVEFY